MNMANCGVLLVCVLAGCISGLKAQSQDSTQCGISFCTKCTSDNICVECLYNDVQYTLNTGSNTCDPICSSLGGCLLCPDPHICLRCMSLWGLEHRGKKVVCNECARFKDCARCDNTSVCTHCTNRLTLGPVKSSVNPTADCGPCGPNCKRCSKNGAGLCDICANGALTPSAAGNCVCPANCANCANGWDTCSSCNTGFVLTPDNQCTPGGNSNCSPNPCQNGGTCAATTTGYSCNCPANARGNNCESVGCAAPNPCLNGGTCRNANGNSFLCNCAPGFNGPTCKTGSSSGKK